MNSVGFYWVTTSNECLEGAALREFNHDDQDDTAYICPNRAARRETDLYVLASAIEAFLRAGDDDRHPECRMTEAGVQALTSEVISWMRRSDRCVIS